MAIGIGVLCRVCGHYCPDLDSAFGPVVTSRTCLRLFAVLGRCAFGRHRQILTFVLMLGHMADLGLHMIEIAMWQVYDLMRAAAMAADWGHSTSHPAGGWGLDIYDPLQSFGEIRAPTVRSKYDPLQVRSTHLPAILTLGLILTLVSELQATLVGYEVSPMSAKVGQALSRASACLGSL